MQQTAPAKEAGGEAARVIATAPADPLPVPAAGCSLRYATLSQRGYYPDAPNKANQDAVLVQERLGGSAGAGQPCCASLCSGCPDRSALSA